MNQELKDKANNYLFKSIEALNKRKQKQYDVALQMELLNESMFYNDIELISIYLNKWQKKAKNQDNVDVLKEMLAALFRIDTHKEHYKKISKKAVVELLEQKSVSNRYADKCMELEKKITVLEKQIEFHEKYNQQD
jgi:hypothetical protein